MANSLLLSLEEVKNIRTGYVRNVISLGDNFNDLQITVKEIPDDDFECFLKILKTLSHRQALLQLLCDARDNKYDLEVGKKTYKYDEYKHIIQECLR